MRTYKFLRNDEVVEAIARSEGEAISRLYICFTNRPKKYEKVIGNIPIEFTGTEEVDRFDFHFSKRIRK